MIDPSAAGLGQVRVFASDGGPHGAARWARLTTSMIVDVDARSPEPEAAENFRGQIAEALEPFFRKPDAAHAERAFAQVREAFRYSRWSAAIYAPEVAANVLNIIARNLSTAQAEQGAYR